MDGSVRFDRSLADLEAQITELAGHLNAATYRWLLLIAEFDRRNGWSDGALKSCAHWLNFKVGLNLGAAREKLRVAHALGGLEKIAAAMASGQLSYSKVRALTRIADASNEEDLLMIALHGTAEHVERLVRYYRRAQEAEELTREARQRETRELRYWYDHDGSLVIHGRLPAVEGALFVEAIEAARAAADACRAAADGACGAADATTGEAAPESEDAERVDDHAARRADALAQVSESFLQHKPAALRTADRFQVVVHIDAETLRDGVAGRSEIEGGPSLPAQTVRRLACDASLVAVLERDAAPLAVGRKTRTIPPAIRRALDARDRGCRFPGCTQRLVDAHHVRHWADGGETALANLVSLCRFHHRSVHEAGYTIETGADGTLRFRRPDGRDVTTACCGTATQFSGRELEAAHAHFEPAIDARTAACRWNGGRMDYDLAVWALAPRANRAEARVDVPAETSMESQVPP
jgi:hypothetical protein